MLTKIVIINTNPLLPLNGDMLKGTTQLSTQKTTETVATLCESATVTTTTQVATETTKSSVIQSDLIITDRQEYDEDDSDTIVINLGEYSANSGRRLVDRTTIIPAEEFLKQYPVTLPSGFAVYECYYEIPTETGLKFNEVENGYIRCANKERTSYLHIYVCKTKSIGVGYIENQKGESQKSYIDKREVTIHSYKRNGDVFAGKFEKNGYYYTFKTSNMVQEEVISALKDLVN